MTKNSLTGMLVMAFGLILCTVFSKFKIFSYISLCLFVIYLLYLIHSDKVYIIKYFAFVFTALATIAGVTFIELMPTFYLKELECFSHFSGSLPLIILSYWLFFFVLKIKDNHYKQTLRCIRMDDFRNEEVKRKINFWAACSGLLLMVLFLYVALHFPPSIQMDRFLYRSTYKLPWILSILRNSSYLLLVFPILALIYANRVIALISILSYVTFFLWTGEKFGGLFSLLCISLIIFCNQIVSLGKQKLKKIMRYVIVTFLGMIVFAVFIAANTYRFNPIDYFAMRTSQQGELWWRTYDLYEGNIHPNEFINEINAFFDGDKPNQECIGAKNGIYKVMYLCAPEAVVTNMLFSGARYTQADYAVVYYYFGFPGVIVYSILMGLIISGIVNLFILSLQNKDYIKAMIYLRFFTMIRTSFSMFTFGGFLSFLSILSYIYLIFTHLSKHRFKLRQKFNMQTKRVRIKNE